MYYCGQSGMLAIQASNIPSGMITCTIVILQVAQDSVVGKVLGGPMLAIVAGMVCSSTGRLFTVSLYSRVFYLFYLFRSHET